MQDVGEMVPVAQEAVRQDLVDEPRPDRRDGTPHAGQWLAERRGGALPASHGGGRCVVDERVCERGVAAEGGRAHRGLVGGARLPVDGEP